MFSTDSEWNTRQNRISWAKMFLCILFCSFIAITTLVGFARYFSVMPVFDTLGIVKVMDREMYPIPMWKYILQEHNEHRIFLTKAVILFDYYFLEGQKILPRFTIFLFNALCFLIFLKAFRTPRRHGIYLCICCIVALFWGLFQLRNFDSMFQLQFFVVNFGASITFFNYSRWKFESTNNWWFVSCLGFAALTAFSMGNGLLVPIVLTIAAVLLKSKLRNILLLGLFSILIWLLYFRGYTPPESHPIDFQGFRSILDLLTYVVFFIGNIFKLNFPNHMDVWFFGVIGTAIGGILLVRTFFFSKFQSRNTLFYSLIIAFVFASVLAAGMARLGEGPSQAMTGRYASTAVLFWAALISYLFDSSLMNKKAFKLGSYTLAFLLLMVATKKQFDTLEYTKEEGTRRRLADISLIAGFMDLETVHIGYYTYQKNWISLMRKLKIALFSERNREKFYNPVDLAECDQADHDFVINAVEDFGIDGKLQGHIYYGNIHGKNPTQHIFRIAGSIGQIVGFGCTTDYPKHLKEQFRSVDREVHWKAYIHGFKRNTNELQFVIDKKRYSVKQGSEPMSSRKVLPQTSEGSLQKDHSYQ